MSPEIMTLAEACRLAGVSPKRIRNCWALRRAGLPSAPWGSFPGFLAGTRWMVRRQDLEAFLSGLGQPAAPEHGSLAEALLELAEDLERREPGIALRLRHLAELAGPPTPGPEPAGRIAARVLALAARTKTEGGGA